MGIGHLEHDWTLSSLGKPEAEPGSPDWAIYTRARIQALLGDFSSSVEHLEYAWNAIIKHQGWQHLYTRNKKPFVSFAAFCIEPKPWGLGYPQSVIEEIIHEKKTVKDVDLFTHATQRGHGQRQGNQYSNVEDVDMSTSSTLEGRPTGNSIAANLRRLRKESQNPKREPASRKKIERIYEQVLAEEISSNAAMVQAGLKQKNINVPMDVKKAAKVLVRNFQDDIDELIQAITQLSR